MTNPSHLTRRRFLAVAGAGGVATWVTACSDGGSPLPSAGVVESRPGFAEPATLTSTDGYLELTLRAEPSEVLWGDSTRYAYTYNGTTPGPTLRIKPGDQLVVHLENGLDKPTNLHTHGLHVSPTGDADNIFIALEPGESRTYTSPVEVGEILLAPGERSELLVTPSVAGSYPLRAQRHSRGGMGMGMGGGMRGGSDSLDTDESVVAIMNVAGERESAGLPASLVDPGKFSVPAPSATRVLELGMGMGMAGNMMSGGVDDMMSFTIDGKTFDGERTDISIAAGTIEEWEIRNSSPMDHPLHLHVWPFLLADGPAQTGWKDTINVPAGESVRITIPFTGLTGRTVYHCHILDHEDLGMMGVVEITV